MSAPHFFVEHLVEGEVLLSETDSRHALRSLRLHPGDEVSLADGRGAIARGEIVRDRRGLAVVRVEEVSRVVRRGAVVSVAFAPPKGDRLSWAIQKLGELGVDEAVLMETARSVRQVREERSGQALARLRAVAREAAMQSRQPFVMEIAVGRSFEECLATGGAPAVMLAQDGARGLQGLLPAEAGGVRLLVGPEGGWTDDEMESARAAGAAIWSLGATVLRTETAAVVGAALVLAHCGRLG
jgi:16S rRNA (uracil1498-N3)-methyltransferase